MELSVFDLSKYLGVTHSTIERWLRQGRLPVSKRGANYKFQSSELQKWAAKNNLQLKMNPEPKKKKETLEISLSEAIFQGGIYSGIQGRDVDSVLFAAVSAMEIIPQDKKTDLIEKLKERESALSTGIGNGIAIPHPRDQIEFLDFPAVGVFFLDQPVDYNAIDSQPVSILFMLLSPQLKVHLHLLSSLSFCLKNPQFMTLLHSKPGYDVLSEKINFFLSQKPF